MDHNVEFFTVVSFNMVLLVMTILIPNFADVIGMGRFYRIALVFLAPLSVIGGEEILAYLQKFRRKSVLKKWSALLLMFMVFSPYFLFQTGFVYEIIKVESWSISLSRYRMPPIPMTERFLYETEVVGTIWLSEHINDNSIVYADDTSKWHVLTSYGLIDWKQFGVLYNSTTTIENEGFIFLRHLNTINGIYSDYGNIWNTSDISSLLNFQNRVYTNGECDIYKGWK
jgi:uncharacterized membrane protein